MVIILLPMLALCSIRNLKHLAPISMLANMLQMAGLGMTFFYLLKDLPPTWDRKPFATWWVLYQSTLLKGNSESTFMLCFQGPIAFILRDSHLCLRGYWCGSSFGESDAGATCSPRLDRCPQHQHGHCHLPVHCHRVLWLPKVRRRCPGLHHAQSSPGGVVGTNHYGHDVTGNLL